MSALKGASIRRMLEELEAVPAFWVRAWSDGQTAIGASRRREHEALVAAVRKLPALRIVRERGEPGTVGEYVITVKSADER